MLSKARLICSVLILLAISGFIIAHLHSPYFLMRRDTSLLDVRIHNGFLPSDGATTLKDFSWRWKLSTFDCFSERLSFYVEASEHF
jgi:hypothetical protein